MINDGKKGFNTMAIHGSKHEKNSKNALNSPIYMTSTFCFDNLEHVEKVMNFESDDYVYTRGNNPTLRELEDALADLENGKGAVAFASGMAAISSTLFSVSRQGSNIIFSNTLYGSTYTVATKLLPQYGVETRVVDLSDEKELADNIDENTVAVYFETPCNPNLKLIDIEKICRVSKAKNESIKVIVDNTFATPYISRPLDLGADVVVHSATKYLGGHGDVVAGIAVSNDCGYIDSLKFEYMCEFGGAMSPFNGWLILRGLKTLGLRMERHSFNAMKISEHLEKSDKVKSVLYPGLKSFEYYELAKKQMKLPGGMLSFEMVGGFDAAKIFVESCKLMKLAVSLGDTETLIEIPSIMTHRGYDKSELAKFGFSKGLVRISAGIEDIEDILEDIDLALSKVI